MRVRLLLASALPLVLSACQRGCGHDRPYTPYRFDADSPASATEPSLDASLSVVSRDAATAFPHVRAAVPPPNADAWELSGVTLRAPSGEHFLAALTGDLDGDSFRDAVAWAASTEGLPHLLFYRGSPSTVGAPTVLAQPPASMSPPSGCSSQPLLEQIGPHSVAAGVQTLCPPNAFPLPPSVGTQWLLVATLTRDPVVRQTFELLPPGPGEALTLSLDAVDRDGDGTDDLALTVALGLAQSAGGPPPPRAASEQATLVWFDRPAGLSRDTQEPFVSLHRRMTELLLSASRKSEAHDVLLGTRLVARLPTILCADYGSPLLSTATGTVHCGPSSVLTEAVLAEARADLTLGEGARALAAYQRLTWLPGVNRTVLRDLEKAIGRGVKSRTPESFRVLAAIPEYEASSAPAWGPLMFIPTGELLVRTAEGVIRVSVPTGEESSGSGIPSWPLAVTAPDGQTRWLDLFDPCDGVGLRAKFATPSNANSAGRDLPVPIPPVGPAQCSPGGAAARLDAIPMSWGQAGLEAFAAGEPIRIAADLSGAVAGERLGTPGFPAHAGSPRSPDGRSLALATPLGILVQTPTSVSLWKLPATPGAVGEARFCTASNEGLNVACVRGGRVLLLDGHPRTVRTP